MPTLADLSTWIILAAAEVPPPKGDEGGGPLSIFGNPLMMLLVIGVLFYFLLIRPQRRKQANQQRMLDAVKKNDKIVTIGGLFGTIVNVQKDSEEVTIKVDDNTRLRILRSAVARVIGDKDDGKD